jgi:hypothetical protein
MKNSIKIYIVGFLALLSFSSCLKDDSITGTIVESENILEIRDAATQESSEEYLYPVFTRSFEVVPDESFDITISYSGPNTAPEDIAIDLVLDETLIDRYNDHVISYVRKQAEDAGDDPDEAEEEAESELFDVMPTELYTISTLKPVIKKGERTTKVTVSVKPNQFDFNYKYGVPLSIKANSKYKISSNFGTVIFNIGAKNDYDGVYEVVGTFTDAQGLFSGEYPKTVELVTVNPTTVDYIDADYGGPYYVYNNGSGAAALYYPRFVFDNATMKLKEIRWSDDNALASTQIDPEMNQFTINGSSKSFVIKYTYGSTNRFTITETWTYKESR